MMKKWSVILISIIMTVAACFAVYASEYKIDSHYWDSNYEKGTLSVVWEKCEYTTKYRVEIYRKALNSSKSGIGTKVYSKTVTGSRLNVSEVIFNKGTGLYSYRITPTYSQDPLDDMAVSDEEFEADAGFVERVRIRIMDPNAPGSLTNYGWKRTPAGWAYTEAGNPVRSAWRNIDGRWYYFNENGDMLTGWQKIDRRYYYLNPLEGQGGYPQGACWMNGKTPDGYMVNGNGEWTVNGIPQVW